MHLQKKKNNNNNNKLNFLRDVVTHKCIIEVKLENVDGIGPSKEFPSSLLYKNLCVIIYKIGKNLSF